MTEIQSRAESRGHQGTVPPEYNSLFPHLLTLLEIACMSYLCPFPSSSKLAVSLVLILLPPYIPKWT